MFVYITFGVSTSHSLNLKESSLVSTLWLELSAAISSRVPQFHCNKVVHSWIRTLRLLCSNFKSLGLTLSFTRVCETRISSYLVTLGLPLEKLKSRSLQCKNIHLSSILTARGVSRKRPVRDVYLPHWTTLKTGRDSCIRRLKKIGYWPTLVLSQSLEFAQFHHYFSKFKHTVLQSVKFSVI